MKKRGMIITSMLIISLMMSGCGTALDNNESSNNGNSVSAAEAASTEESVADETSKGESTASDEDGDSKAESLNSSKDNDTTTENSTVVGNSVADETTITEMFTDRDRDASYDESEAINIKLNQTTAAISDASSGSSKNTSDTSAVSIDGSLITIKKEGVYVFSGTLSDGQIVVDAGDSDKVQIVLNGADITCSNSACIYVKNADKTFITLVDGTTNNLCDTGAAYEADGEERVDGVIYSKDDVTFNGQGSLSINAGYNHGIVGNDDVKITAGTYTITATGKGVKANDSIRVLDGNISISSKDDALHTSNGDEDGKGYIYIAGGTFDLSSEDDGIHAEKDLTIDGGIINVAKSYEGIEGATITINGGDIDVVASDDGMNATGTSQTAAATESGKDAFGESSPFDGNQASNNDGSAPSMDDREWDFDGKFGRGMGGGGMMDAVEDAVLTINGGNIYVNASGDGIDSNGYLYVYGGTTVVDGPENDGNGSLDTGYEGIIYGGTIIAAGSSGMAETFSAESKEYSILYNFSETLSAGTQIQLLDSSGNVISTHTTAKTANSIVIASPDIKEGKYTIKAGDSEEEITVSSISTSAGAAGGFGGGFGGGNMGGKRFDDNFTPQNENGTGSDEETEYY